MKHGHGVYIDVKISLCDYMCFFNKQLATIWQILFFIMYSVTYVWYKAFFIPHWVSCTVSACKALAYTKTICPCSL